MKDSDDPNQSKPESEPEQKHYSGRLQKDPGLLTALLWAEHDAEIRDFGDTKMQLNPDSRPDSSVPECQDDRANAVNRQTDEPDGQKRADEASSDVRVFKGSQREFLQGLEPGSKLKVKLPPD